MRSVQATGSSPSLPGKLAAHNLLETMTGRNFVSAGVVAKCITVGRTGSARTGRHDTSENVRPAVGPERCAKFDSVSTHLVRLTRLDSRLCSRHFRI
jgi:hypothetical protein